MGILLHRQGDLVAARPYLEHALAIRKQVLGMTHPDTRLSLNNLAALLKDQGEYAAACPPLRRARLAILINASGQRNLAALDAET
ncbi:tetratricopeptide repeat protein [Candidatus Gracilibacteria bacterium]|nr:tetratricopeptide repeat protein [Candidatus Gracilibacteria bacterium]